MIPSKNPQWADCGEIENCGLSQIFDFTLSKDKIWFTEWVENNIGVIDTSIPLSYDVDLDKQKITLQKGEKVELTLSITPTRNASNLSIATSNTALFSDLIVKPDTAEIFELRTDLPKTIQISVTASENALPDIYKILISVQSDDFVVSKFLTVIVEQ
jgi:virginiamycin B lyase